MGVGDPVGEKATPHIDEVKCPECGSLMVRAGQDRELWEGKFEIVREHVCPTCGHKLKRVV
jgi:DNA-directed RNA polymerase subunit RPC12/RpoP